MSELAFEGQREDEEVRLVFRRHILTTGGGVIFFLIMTGVGFLLMLMWPDDSRMFWLFLAAVLIGLLGYFYTYLLWYFSIYIVTNERIRQISQHSLFKKNVIDLGLDKIQSVSMNIPGATAGLFGYGTILIQTGVGDLVISKVARPNLIHNKLQNIIKEAVE